MATKMILLCVLALSTVSLAAPKDDKQQITEPVKKIDAKVSEIKPSKVDVEKTIDQDQPDLPPVVLAESEAQTSGSAVADARDDDAANAAGPEGGSSSDLDTANTFWGGYGGYGGRWGSGWGGGWGGYYRPYYGGWGGGWRRNYGWGRGYGGYPYWG